MLRLMGEWLRAYQRVTHYFRALDVWQPPPHLLAIAVIERAIRRASRDHGLTPLRLAMDEVHAVLGQCATVSPGAAAASPDWHRSVLWRIGSWFLDAGTRDVPGNAMEIPRLRPVPPALPGPMAPQPLEASPLARAIRALTAGIRHPRGGAGWRRRHA